MLNYRRSNILRNLIIVMVIFFLHNYASAQEEVHFNKIRVKAGRYITFSGKTTYCEKETEFTLADTIDYFISKRNVKKNTDQFYGKLKKRLQRRDDRISKTLYKVTFGKDQKTKKQVQTVESSISYFHPYRNRTIRNLYFKELNVFGTDIKDTAKVVRGPYHFLNRFHIPTHDRVINNNLLIREGDRINPMIMADNERVLRQLPFIKDAKIMVARRPSSGADVAVVTRDVFPLRFDINPSVLSGNRFGFSNINLFGTGHELETELLFNDRDRNVSHDTYLNIRNVRGTFISSSINVANSFSKEGAGVQFFRDFYTPNTLYAGGGEISRYRIRQIFLPNGQILGPNSDLTNSFELNSTQSTQDIWIGRAFTGIENLPIFLDLRRWRLLAAARINRVKFSDRPPVNETNNELFHHRTRFIASIGLSSRHYYKDVLVNFFGRTEDIPAGNLIQWTAGYEIGEFKSRKYAGIRFAKGDFIPNFGYLRGELNTGSFMYDGQLEQGVVQTKFGYFTRLYNYDFLKFRLFFNLEYTVGIRRRDLEIVDLNDPYGIRGFQSILLAGTRRFVFSQETVLFTPIYLAGFRVAAFNFIDVAFLKGTPFEGKTYSAVGVGVRMRNENLAFNTIQFRFAFYPFRPDDMGARDFVFSTRVSEPVEDFDLRGPDVVKFRN